MKVFSIITAIVFTPFCSFSQNTSMIEKYGLLSVNKNLLVDQTETNVAEWLGYIVSVCDSNIVRSFKSFKKISDADRKYLENFEYPDSLLPEKGILQTLDWKDLLSKENGYELKHTAGANYPQFLPLNSKYFSNKKLEKQLKYFLGLPVTGITYKQAINFCIWRTKIDSIQYSPYEDYLFRLPTVAEYNLMNDNIDSIPKLKNGKLIDGFNYRGLNCITTDSAMNATLGKNLILIWNFNSSKLGIFGIQGNAAEMTCDEGIAYGGSYFQYAIESYNGKTQTYDAPQRWLGMRCVAVRKNNTK